MAADRTVEVKLTADVLSYKAAMSSAAASTSKLSTAQAAAEKKIMASNAKITKSAQVAGRAGNVLAVAGAAALVVSAKNASTLEEALSKSNNVFKEQARVVEDWSKTMADSFGISQQASLAAASAQGDMWQQMGLSAAESTKLSTSIVELTSDLGSYHDLKPEEVQLKLNAAYRGEFESIKSILPGIRMKRVQEEALIMTGKKSVDQLTQGEKALATHKLILEDSTDAQGDYARTSDSAANSTKRATANLTDASAELGESLLPIVVKVTEGLSKLSKVFSGLSDTQQNWAIGLGIALVAGLKMAPMIAGWITSSRLKSIQTALDTVATTTNTTATTANTTAVGANGAARKGLAGKTAAGTAATTASTGALTASTAGMGASLAGAAKLTGGLALLAAGIWAAGETATNWAQQQRAGVVENDNVKDAIIAGNGVMGDRQNAIADNIIAENGWKDNLEESGVSLETQRLAALGNSDAVREVNTSLAEQEAAYRMSSTAGSYAVSTTKDFSIALEQNRDELAQTNEQAAEAQRLLQEKLAPALEQATRGYQLNSVHADQYGQSLVNLGREAGKSEEDIRSMLVAAGAKPKQIRLLMDIRPAKAALAEAQEGVDDLRQYELPEVQVATELLDESLEKSQDDLNSLKQSNKPGVEIEIEKAKEQIRKIQWLIDQIKGGNVTVDVHRVLTTTTETKAKLVKRASGGAVFGPGTGTSDSIPAMLSDGEYVIKASSARRIGYDRLDAMNQGVQRFAKGGKAKAKKKRQEAKQNAYNERFAAWGERFRGIGEYRAEKSRSFGKGQLSSFDFGAAEGAMRDYTYAVTSQTRAEDNLYEARKRANSASRADKPAAIRALAEAQRALAAASEDVASAEKAKAAAAPTAANILANYQGRVAKTQKWANDMNTLRAWGLPPSLASEILNSGLESGSAMAAALVAGGAGNIASFQANANALRGATDSLGFSAGMSDAIEGDSTYHDLESAAAAAIGRNPAQVRAEKAAAKARKKRKKKKKKNKRALGGNVYAGEEYLVGEQGHEMFVPSTSGRIMSNASLMSGRAASGSAGSSSAPISISMDGNSLWQGLVTHSRTSGFTIRDLGS